MVVRTPLEASRMAGRLDLAHEVGFDARGQYIVDRLFRDRSQAHAHAIVNLFDGGMRVIDQPFEHRITRRGHAESAVAKCLDGSVAFSTHCASHTWPLI